MWTTSSTHFPEKVSPVICACSRSSNVFFCSTATWPKRSMSNKDVIRLKMACDVMELDDRQSIHNTAVNAFGAQGVNTHMYVAVLVLNTFG